MKTFLQPPFTEKDPEAENMRLFPEVDMATLTENYEPGTARIAMIRQRDKSNEKRPPRRCMVVSVGLILAALSIPALMAIHLLPITFLLGFLGFALAASGGVMALVFCGEI
jgi:hypothetical protein